MSDEGRTIVLLDGEGVYEIGIVDRLNARIEELEKQRDEARRWLLSIDVVPMAPAAGVQESILEGARMLRPLEGKT